MPIFKQSGRFFTANNKMFITPWKPNKLPGLVFWGDANSKNIVSSDNIVDKWLDISGHLNNGIQTSNSKKPIFINNIINGYPALYFQNTKSLTIPLTLNYYTIFSVVKCNDNDTLYEFGDTNSNTGFYLNGGSNSIATSKNTGISNSSIKTVSNNWLAGGWKIIVHRYNGTHSTHTLFVNGFTVSLTTYSGNADNTGSLNKTSNLTLGSMTNNSTGIDGYFAEYLVFNSYLQISNISTVTNYLNSKYIIY